MNETKTIPRTRQRIASLPTTSTELNNSSGKRPLGARRHSFHDPCTSSTSRQRTASLQTASTELNNTLEKLGDSSSNPNLPGTRRHSLYDPCTSSFKDAPDGFKNVFNSSATSYSLMDVGLFEASHAVKMQARKACFPLLNGAQQFSFEPVARRDKIKVGKRNSWTWLRSASEGDQASPLDPKPALPEITTNKLQFSRRRQSLPILTEGSLSNNKTQNPLPQITQPENHSLHEQKFEDYMGSECLRFNGIRPSQKVSKLHDKRNRTEAMRDHVEKAENGYDDNEMRAAGLFGWLKDQTDNSETS